MKIFLWIVMLLTSVPLLSMEDDKGSGTPKSAKEMSSPSRTIKTKEELKAMRQSPKFNEDFQAGKFTPKELRTIQEILAEEEAPKAATSGQHFWSNKNFWYNIGKGGVKGTLWAAGGATVTQIGSWLVKHFYPHKEIKVHPAIWVTTVGGIFLYGTGLIKKLHPEYSSEKHMRKKQKTVYYSAFGVGGVATLGALYKWGRVK